MEAKHRGDCELAPLQESLNRQVKLSTALLAEQDQLADLLARFYNCNGPEPVSTPAEIQATPEFAVGTPAASAYPQWSHPIGKQQLEPSQVAEPPARPGGPATKLDKSVVKKLTRKTTRKDLSEVEQSTRRDRFSNFVESVMFESVFSVLIVLNVVVMAADAQCTGTDLGRDYGLYEYVSCAANFPHIESFFNAVNLFFGIAFSIEVVLKILAFRSRFVCNGWNWLDTGIVLGWMAEEAGINLGFNPLVARSLKFVKLGRLMKLLKTLQSFDSLYIMVTSLKGAVSAFAWSALLMTGIQTFVSLVLFAFLKEVYFKNGSYPFDQREVVYERFGTFTRTMFTMFELTLANWTPTIRILSEYVSEYFMLFGVFYKLTMGFAVVGVLNSVFMQETFKVAQTDDVLMMRQCARSRKLFKTQINTLLDIIDKDRDGSVSYLEFSTIVEDPEVRLWLGAMDITWCDTKNFWALLHGLKGGDGEICRDDLLRAMAQVRGAARSVDIRTLRHEVDMMKNALLVLHQDLLRVHRIAARTSVEGKCAL